MKRAFKIGDKFKLSADALENYGEQYADKVFRVDAWFDHYAKLGSNDPHGHPGFDAGAGSPLYETKDLSFAVYEWEMEKV